MANLQRVQDDLRALSALGATPEGGVTRLAWTEEEREAHRLAVRWMEAEGLTVWQDAAGNSFGLRAGEDQSLPAILVGSHLDSVANGGKLDGTLGFAAGLEAVRVMNEARAITRHPVVLAVLVGEEAARFAGTCFGSKLLTGTLDRSELDGLVDARGITPAGAMRDAGLDPDRVGEARWDHARIAAYVELHIEQGTVLERLGKQIGVVTAIAAATRYRAVLKGVVGHSGATPMGARRDALAAAAEIVLGVERIASTEAGTTTVGTVGILKVKPGAMTVIPGEAELGIDMRDTTPEPKRLASERIAAMIEEVCRRRGIDLDLVRLLDDVPGVMSPLVQDAICGAAEKLGQSWHRMPSGAGHDARIMSFAAPSGMIFVPSRGGISHSPEEWTDPEDILAGVEVLAETLLRLDRTL